MNIDQIPDEDSSHHFQKSKDWNTIAKFKDDIVNALSQIEDKVTNKNNSIENMINSKHSVFETRLTDLDNSIKNINSKINQLFIMHDKYKEVLPLQQKNNETLISHEVRLNNLSKEISNSCYKYDKIVLDNLLVPGQVGEYCKFKNVKECLDYTLNQIALFNSFKDKFSTDFKLYKEKIDQYNKKTSMDIDLAREGLIKYAQERIDSTGKKFDDKLNDYIDLVNEAKLDNNTYAAQLKDLSNELKKEMNKLLTIKDEILRNNNETNLKVQEMTNNTMENFNNLKLDFVKINRHFSEIVEFIKDVRFKRNLNTEVSKNDIKKLANNLLNNTNTNISNCSPEPNKQTINNTTDDFTSENESTKIVPLSQSALNTLNNSTLAPLTFNPKLKKNQLVSKAKNLIIQSPLAMTSSSNETYPNIAHSRTENLDLPNLGRKKPHLRKGSIHSIVKKKMLNITSQDNELETEVDDNGPGKRHLPKTNKKLSLMFRNNSEPKTKVQKSSKSKMVLFDHVPKKKVKENFVYKMIKNEDGKLTKTSSLCYFKPKKTVQ